MEFNNNSSEVLNHFTVIVAGRDPEKQMKPYDMNLKVKPYTVFKFADAKKLHNKAIEVQQALCNIKTGIELEEAQETLRDYQNMDDIDFYMDITSGYDYDNDTGDAISDINPEGKWKTFEIGKIFSNPFKLVDGTESYSAKKSEIEWKLMHMYNTDLYKRAWELVIDGSKPQNKDESKIYDCMKNRAYYFKKFETKDKYIASNAAFWAYAFLSEKTGWVEMEMNVDQFEWIINYYNKFIAHLPHNTTLTLYECIR